MDTDDFYLPILLRQLKAQLPALGRLSTERLPVTVARAVAELQRLLPQLPDFSENDLPALNNFMPPLLVTAKTATRATVKLSHGLITALNLRAGQPANLLPPSSTQTVYWHLDLRTDAPHNIDWYPGKTPKIRGVALHEGLLLPGQCQQLRLIPGNPSFPSIYPLLPDGPPAPYSPKHTPTSQNEPNPHE